MPVSKEFVEHIVDQLRDWGDVSVRRMFGGAGLFCEGLMFGLVADDVVYFKVDITNQSKYEAAGSRPFKPWDDKSTVLSFWELPADLFECSSNLADWAEESLAIQRVK